MFAKRLLQKPTQNHHRRQHDVRGYLTPADLDFCIAVHYGIPSTASTLAFDPIQRLLAIGTLDGRIKVIGGDNIEGLLISPKQLPYKYLEFISNQGYLVSITNDNNIQVWNLELRSIACSLQWESNITAFSLVQVSHFMYVGDEYGMLSVLKHEAENRELVHLPYHISANSFSEAAGSSLSNHQPIVGILPQPCFNENRVLIAYESGLIILWDVVKAQALVVRGDKVLELKDGIAPSGGTSLPDVTSGQHLEEKEISSLCWVSSNGSILAAGYVDGDIFLWKTSTPTKSQQAGTSSSSVIKLQLSSAEKKLPVIVLHWSAKCKSQNNCDGQLFIYGGIEIGSDEVLTVLSLEWSPGMEIVRCVGRADLILTGSFADMILLPPATTIFNKHNADLFVLTSPGHLQFFSHDSLSVLASRHDKKITLSSVEFPAVIPTVSPTMTAAKFTWLPQGENSSRFLSETATHINLNGGKWPLTGGVANQLSSSGNNTIYRIYAVGYSDGSIRIWDATFPVLSLLCVIHGEIKGVEVAGSTASVSELDLCSMTLGLAAGNELGLIRVYDFSDRLKETSLHIVYESKHEVHKLPHDGGLKCRGVFGPLNSPVQVLQYENHGAKLSVGYKCGRVAVLDMNQLSVLFLTDHLASPSFPVISLMWTSFVLNDDFVKNPKYMGPRDPAKPAEELMFVLTKDAKAYIIDGVSGNIINSRAMNLKKESTAISLHVIETYTSSSLDLSYQKPLQHMIKDAGARNESSVDATSVLDQHEIAPQSSPEYVQSRRHDRALLVLLCSKGGLRLYSLKSVLQGENRTVCKVKLSKPCCWTSTFKRDGRICGLVLLYENGDIDVRSLPDLELVKETSLRSILRWNFKANMNRMMSSTENGQIALANECEVAFISLLLGENNFRVPESLPCLHDKVLAAAAEAAISASTSGRKKQGGSRVLGNLVKGLNVGKANNVIDLSANSSPSFEVFARNPFPDPFQRSTDYQEDDELDIDDIKIDEPVPVTSASSHTEQNHQKSNRSEREKLYDGEGTNLAPRLRTHEEILAAYRKAGDASSVAGQAKNKLLERQEKLERINKRMEDLQNGAEDFASLANELVKAMERRKWWQL